MPRQLGDHLLRQAVRQAAEHEIDAAPVDLVDLGQGRQVVQQPAAETPRPPACRPGGRRSARRWRHADGATAGAPARRRCSRWRPGSRPEACCSPLSDLYVARLCQSGGVLTKAAPPDNRNHCCRPIGNRLPAPYSGPGRIPGLGQEGRGAADRGPHSVHRDSSGAEFSPALRAPWPRKLGENGYKILFSLVSAVGLVLAGIGYGQAPREQIFEPSQTARTFLPVAMAIAFILVAVRQRAGPHPPACCAIRCWRAC